MLPVSDHILRRELAAMNIASVATATIRQILALANRLEPEIGEPMVHLEMGNPGLPPSQVGIEAERQALLDGVAGNYPNIAGIKPLKDNGSRFLKAFLDIDVPSRCIVPTVGSMQGTFTMFMLMGKRLQGKDTILFLDPGFPVQHQQVTLLGLKQESLDLYDCRGEALEARLEEILQRGNVTAIAYSTPNNPAWVSITPVEYRILARMAEKYDLVILEDLAYLGMDFRNYYGEPFKEPYIPTIARYTDRFVLFVSASKIFSYAGQRIAMVAISPAVYDRHYDALERLFKMPALGDAYIFGVLYCASSGTSHSSQYAFAKMLGAAADGELNFVKESQEYGRRAAEAKKLFTDNGFSILYSHDGEHPISDGFFFTVAYPGLSGDKLQEELLRYGVSTIALGSTGSRQQGLRICVSMLSSADHFRWLGERLKAFNSDHK